MRENGCLEASGLKSAATIVFSDCDFGQNFGDMVSG